MECRSPGSPFTQRSPGCDSNPRVDLHLTPDGLRSGGLLLEAGAAGPAEVEGTRIFLAALGANHRGSRGGRPQEILDQLACPRRIAGLLDPDLRQGSVDGQLARDAR